MKKQRKKRKLDSYAMGSGNTGVVKNYMPDPNEVFRQNEINVAKAASEASSNPYIMGLEALGGMMTQAGLSTMQSGVASKKKQDKMADTATNIIGGITNAGIFAKGTGPKGAPAKVNVEDGEILEDPNGNTMEVDGKKHSQGGEDMVVPEGTRIFSDQLEIGGKTMADRKKARDKRLKKAEKVLENDKTSAIAKETLRKTQEAYDIEEESDLMAQGFARHLDEVYSAAMGTSSEGVYAKGTGEEGVDALGNFFGGFTGGDALSLVGNLYSGIAPLVQTKKAAADDTVNPNYYKDFGEDALQTIEEAGESITGQQKQAEKALTRSRNTAMAQAKGSARGINQVRAQQLGIDANTNQAMGDLYMNFSKMLMDNLYKKSGLEAQIDQTVMTGAKEADIANRMDKDAAMTNLGIAQSNMGTAIQTMGKDLNENAVQNYMSNVYNEMFGNPVEWSKKGKLKKSGK